MNNFLRNKIIRHASEKYNNVKSTIHFKIRKSYSDVGKQGITRDSSKSCDHYFLSRFKISIDWINQVE